MKKKMLFILLCFAAMSLATAEIRTYIKGMYGAGFRTRDWGTTTSSSGTTTELGNVYTALSMMLTPAFGIRPWAYTENVFLSGLSFELSVDVGLGSAYGVSSGSLADASAFEMYSITPTIMAMYGQEFGRIVPYAGLGFSIPILFSWEFSDSSYNSSTVETDIVKVGWNINVAVGVGYAITSSVMPVIEVIGGWGYGQGIGASARVGFVFTLPRMTKNVKCPICVDQSLHNEGH